VAFSDLKFGYASALAFILFGLMLLITIVVLRVSRWQAEY
jgi:ABC-type sugar transport system permease subunit